MCVAYSAIHCVVFSAIQHSAKYCSAVCSVLALSGPGRPFFLRAVHGVLLLVQLGVSVFEVLECLLSSQAVSDHGCPYFFVQCMVFCFWRY